MAEKVLPEFQEFLIARKLAPEKHIPCHVRWVSRFLSFKRRYEERDRSLLIDKFLDSLRSGNNMEDWQVR